MSEWHGGKGSSQRPTDMKKFGDNWDRIFGKKDDTNNCPRCGGEMLPGKYMQETLTGGIPDFEGTDNVVTVSAGGPGVLSDCLKCADCGNSTI